MMRTVRRWEDDTVHNDIREFEAKGNCGAFVEFDVRKDESIIVQAALSLVDMRRRTTSRNWNLMDGILTPCAAQPGLSETICCQKSR